MVTTHIALYIQAPLDSLFELKSLLSIMGFCYWIEHCGSYHSYKHSSRSLYKKHCQARALALQEYGPVGPEVAEQSVVGHP